jgi:hypothetical protein
LEDLTLLGAEELGLKPLDAALRKLRRLRWRDRRRLLEACAACAEGAAGAREAALLRGVAAALDCPVPVQGRRLRRGPRSQLGREGQRRSAEIRHRISENGKR